MISETLFDIGIHLSFPILILVAIFYLPVVPAPSLLLLILVAGLEVLLYNKQEERRWFLYRGLAVASYVYAIATTILILEGYGTINNALLTDLFKTLVPVAVLATFALAWIGRKKIVPASTPHKTLTAFLRVAFFSLLIITPFIIGGLHDYNRRWDTSPPQVIQLIVVDKSIGRIGEEVDTYELECETLDGSRRFRVWVTIPFYIEHEIGSLLEITLHNGALGYEWLVLND